MNALKQSLNFLTSTSGIFCVLNLPALIYVAVLLRRKYIIMVIELNSPINTWLAILQSNWFSPMEWCCPSVHLTSKFWLTFAFKFWNFLCNSAIPFLAVSCFESTMLSWWGFDFLAQPHFTLMQKTYCYTPDIGTMSVSTSACKMWGQMLKS